MDGLTLTDGNPGAQSVYLLSLNHHTGPLCFETLEKHNIFGWQIWLLFKHYFHEDAERFLTEVPKESEEMLKWTKSYMQQYSERATTIYGEGFSLERHPLPYWGRG